jgi:competence protein ComEA
VGEGGNLVRVSVTLNFAKRTQRPARTRKLRNELVVGSQASFCETNPILRTCGHNLRNEPTTARRSLGSVCNLTLKCQVMHNGTCLRFAMGAGLAGTLLTGAVKADLPEGYGKTAAVQVCGKCHSPEKAVSLHQSDSEWEETITKMVKLGARGSDDEFDAILVYLTQHFGLQKPGPININKANAVDLQTTLLLRRSQAMAILQYRSRNGDFKSIDDLRKIPGLDFSKIEAKRARILFLSSESR